MAKDIDIEMVELEAEARAEMAESLFDQQDAETQAAVIKLANAMKPYVTGPVARLDGELVFGNLKHVAMELMRNCAISDIQIANFQFGDNCASCGVDL